jgi:endonuclease/exonuclease/phosphatase family metal-dependent hydrolase
VHLIYRVRCFVFSFFLVWPVLSLAQPLTVASLNVAMAEDASAIVKELRSVEMLAEADVLLLQEVIVKEDRSVAHDVARQLGRHVVTASPDGRNSQGALAVLSRYPLSDQRVHKLKPQKLVFRSRSRVALAVTAGTPFGPVRLINTHLDTRINPAERLAQLRPALDDASCFFGPSVIGGDFNTNDMQWVSNVVPVPFPGWQAERVRVLMGSRGFHTPFQSRRATFDHLGMQLDWIYSAGLEVKDFGIQPIAFSDHHAVWARLSLSRGSSPETARSRASRPGGA